MPKFLYNPKEKWYNRGKSEFKNKYGKCFCKISGISNKREVSYEYENSDR